MRIFERLRAWEACHTLTLQVYRLTDRFPRHELYGLTSQLRRAAFSAEANIAEGAAKRGATEYARFLGISFGSLVELSCGLRLAKELGYAADFDWDRTEELRRRATALTWKLYRAVRAARREGGRRPLSRPHPPSPA